MARPIPRDAPVTMATGVEDEFDMRTALGKYKAEHPGRFGT